METRQGTEGLRTALMTVVEMLGMLSPIRPGAAPTVTARGAGTTTR